MNYLNVNCKDIGLISRNHRMLRTCKSLEKRVEIECQRCGLLIIGGNTYK